MGGAGGGAAAGTAAAGGSGRVAVADDGTVFNIYVNIYVNRLFGGGGRVAVADDGTWEVPQYSYEYMISFRLLGGGCVCTQGLHAPSQH